MKRKGFTLIELLGVITLLGILAFIAVPAVTRSINNSRENAYNVQVGNLISSAKNWVADHPEAIPEADGESTRVTLGTLKDGNYVEDDLENPKTKKMMSNDTYITITNINGAYEYTVTVIDE